jgi:hypothetical protein
MKLEAIDHQSLEWMPKHVWGPIKWRELHYRGLTDFPMDKEHEWFAAFCRGLPCPQCREHFESFLRDHPPDFSSREAFFSWTVRAHNHVNRVLGAGLLDDQEARRRHMQGGGALKI